MLAGSVAKFTITSICARYAALSGQSMEVKPFHNKIKKPAVTELTGMLLKHYADLLSAKFVKPELGSLLLNILREHGLAVENIEAIAGSYFMLRGKCNMTGTITACFLKGKALTNFIGKDLKEPLIRAYRPHDILDMNITLNNGLQVRIQRVWSNNKDTVSYLITNIPQQCFPAQYAVLIRKLRWSVEILFKCLKSGINLRGVNTSYLTIVYTIVQACLIAAIIKYLIYLYLDEKQQYYISMYKVFVNCDPWWDGVCVNLLKIDNHGLKQNLRLIRTLANQYRKSQTSKVREKEFKSFEAVIKFLAKAPIKTTIEANFSYA